MLCYSSVKPGAGKGRS